jgi:hypothetical protein
MAITPTALAAKLNAKFFTPHGRDITITSATNGYVAGTGTNTPTLTNHTVRATPPLAYERRYVDGNTIREGDLKYVILATGISFTLTQGQKITDEGRVYRIVSVKTSTYDYLGSTFTAYTVQARGDG